MFGMKGLWPEGSKWANDIGEDTRKNKSVSRFARLISELGDWLTPKEKIESKLDELFKIYMEKELAKQDELAFQKKLADDRLREEREGIQLEFVFGDFSRAQQEELDLRGAGFVPWSELVKIFNTQAERRGLTGDLFSVGCDNPDRPRCNKEAIEI